MNEEEDPQVNKALPEANDVQEAQAPTQANTAYNNAPSSARANDMHSAPTQAYTPYNAPTQPFTGSGPTSSGGVSTINTPASMAATGTPPTQPPPFHQPALAGGRRRRTWLWVLLVLVVLVIIVALIWSNTHSGSNPSQGVFVQGNVPANGGPAVKTFQVGDHPLLVIQGHGSDISVQKGNDGAVTVSARKHGSNFAPDPNDTRVVYNQGDDGQGHDRITIGTQPLGKDVDYDVTVPAATLVQIQIDSGSVSVNGISGVTIDTNNGSLDVENIQGPVNAHTESGDITGRNIKGQTVVNGSSGSIRLDNITGQLQAVTNSGDVIVRQSALSGQSKLKTSSGSVRYDGSLADNGSYDMSTNSGDISMTLPDNAAFQLNASTGSGNVNNEFGSNTVGNTPRAQITATIGSGSVSVNKA
jgi:Putative adhesin